MRGETLKGHLDLLLLAVLAERPAHGYAVIEALQQRSGGLFALPEGTIYPALHRLEAHGLLVSHWQADTPRRRRVYTLTPQGWQALVQRRQEWHAFAGAMSAALGS